MTTHTPQKPDPISAGCRTNYKAVHHDGNRSLKDIIWIIMHDQESTTAEAAASWFADNRSAGSAHICVDDKTCFRTLENNQIPWAAPGANLKGFHIEQAGYGRWSTALWGKHRATLERAAYKAAAHCHKFGIPPRFITAKQLKAGMRGISTHAECTKAFGGDHTDPGFGWPRRLFMRRVRFYYLQHHAK